MYLKVLEIQGFKSFPDKTILNFEEDLTAIVGPNGSGKSNISDAIRWVMGEQSAKGLRGSRMEDVIFGGTQKRRQVGFAQVTLILDNTGHIFPSMEESEVSVTRRYYRSGESEYYINRQAVRLRDVTELFMDTGLGREGYSIIGQGKIDEILSAKSGERREIFEEAAGISKFRHRKEEAERKLERTEENLLRVNDKIAELELQVEPLRNQAETAKRYLILRDELRALELSVWLEQLDALKANARQTEQDFHAAEAERDEIRASMDELYALAGREEEAMHEQELAAESIRTERTQTEGIRHDRESSVAVLEGEIAHQQENIRRIQEEVQEAGTRAGNLETEAAAQHQQAETLSGQIREQSDALEVLLQRSRDITERAGGAQSETERLRQLEAEALSAAADARALTAAANAEQAQILERQQTVAAERQDAITRLTSMEENAAQNQQDLTAFREQARSAENVVKGYQARLESRREKAEQTSRTRVQLTMDTAALDDRIRLLTDMQKDYEGFTRAVRAVMQSANRLQGIHGPVADLMSTEERYALAMETALGAGMQNIVTDREEDAKNAIEYLRRTDAGRATFLPLSAIRGEILRQPGLERENGFAGIASELIRCEPRYTQIFRNLLGRTVIVENLDQGIPMARKYHNAFRIVTLDGQVINRGGSMTGGSVSRGTGVLSRRTELEKLKEQSVSAHQNLFNAKEEESRAQRELSAAQYELETAEEQLRETERQLLRLEESRRHLEELLPPLRENVERLNGEVHTLSGRAEENQQRLSEYQNRVAEREAEAEKFRKEMEAALAGQSELLEQSRTLAEAVSGARETLASLNAEHDAALRRAEDLQGLAAALSEGKLRQNETLRRCEETIHGAQEQIAQLRKEMETLSQREKALSDELSNLTQQKLETEARRTARNRESQEMNERLLSMERTTARLEQKMEAAALEQKQILDKLWETYELTYSSASEQRREIGSLAKANRRIGELKREVRNLGTINLGAIEEFERVNTRYTYLTDQRNDVEKARAELNGIISEITSQMTVIFEHQFRLLSESFQSTFIELFGGGAARLELEDEQDILNCGIEIKAQPPGKTLKTISLLSGGEKAFVAIALYFSILKVHPTPFVVMDEIEAALDDVNVTRYARYMRNLTAHTQFIVITHRRGTMEEADVLYGVTMQEQGVSKILTINLNDMERELKLEH